jgi:hypothetical protein
MLREDRGGTIETPEQYFFVYSTLNWSASRKSAGQNTTMFITCVDLIGVCVAAAPPAYAPAPRFKQSINYGVQVDSPLDKAALAVALDGQSDGDHISTAKIEAMKETIRTSSSVLGFCRARHWPLNVSLFIQIQAVWQTCTCRRLLPLEALYVAHACSYGQDCTLMFACSVHRRLSTATLPSPLQPAPPSKSWTSLLPHLHRLQQPLIRPSMTLRLPRLPMPTFSLHPFL